MIYIYIYLSMYLSIYLSVYLSIYMYLYGDVLFLRLGRYFGVTSVTSF